MAKKLMLDLSHHNGARSLAEFKQMKKDGIYAVTVKLTEGQTWSDPLAASFIKNAKASGLLINAYHFFRANNTDEAVAEAKYFVSKAKSLGIPTDARLSLDIEVELKGDMTANALAFLQMVKGLGYSCVDWYSYQPFIDEHLKEEKLPAQPWKAAYPAHYDTSKPPFKNVGAWQYTNRIKLVGISGNFDCSIDYTGAYTSRAKAKKAVKKASKPLTIIQFMQSKKMDSSYKNRAKLAKQYGIKGYMGTAAQNIKLLGYLQAGKKPTAAKPAAEKLTPYLVTASVLNMRQSPNGKIIDTLKHGDQVEVVSESQGWAKLKSGSTYVYVGSKYLKKK